MILRELGVTFRFTVIPILRKDSLHITDEDRELIRATIAAQPTKHVLVTHGTDSLFNIQFLQYADQTVALAPLVAAANLPADRFAPVIELYGAYLDRAPDAAGLHYWLARSGEGMSLADIARSFYVSAEAVALRPATQSAGRPS